MIKRFPCKMQIQHHLVFNKSKQTSVTCHFQDNWRLADGRQTSFTCVKLIQLKKNYGFEFEATHALIVVKEAGNMPCSYPTILS